MAKTNTKIKVTTHEGARAETGMKPLVELQRTVATCLLWEDAHYESGNEIADRIRELCSLVEPEELAALAIKARTDYKLRHVPLFLVRQMAELKSCRGRKDGLVSKTLEAVIRRPDEMGEFLSLYWKDKKIPLSGQIKKGLAAAFDNFGEYSLSKWDQDGAKIKLRDVMFLVHPDPGYSKVKPSVIPPISTSKYRRGASCRSHEGKAGTFEKVASRTLATPDTWEVALSAGKDKKETWERLLRENKLGYIALLMNLRNMEEAKVEREFVKKALIDGATNSKALPFRFVSAAKHAPHLEDTLGQAMVLSLETMDKLDGKTVFVVDVSGSMRSAISEKSEVNRVDTASALAMLLREICEDPVIYATAGNDGIRIHATALVPSRHAFALRDAIKAKEGTLGGGGIFLTQCMDYISEREKNVDRVIVFTDEQDCDLKLSPATAKLLGKHNYILNVAQYNRAIGFGRWTTINGWSEKVVDWIRATEELEASQN